MANAFAVRPAEVKTVFRLVRCIEKFIPPGAAFPNREAFEPSSDDKKEAAASGLPVRVSVFDRHITRVAHAKLTRRSGDRMLAYGLHSADIIAVGSKYGRSIKVVRDPLDPKEGPGWRGHCGIEGLDRAAGVNKVQHKAMLDEMVQRCCFNLIEQATPLAKVKERFRSKQGLIEALLALPGDLIVASDGDVDILMERLSRVANRKLLRLYDIATIAIQRWQTRQGMVDYLLRLEFLMQDEDRKNKLLDSNICTLYDMIRARESRFSQPARLAPPSLPLNSPSHRLTSCPTG